jgi:alkyl hydroperoxide reductase subunit AhpF
MAFLRPADAERVRQRLAGELESDVDVTLFASPSSGLFVPGRVETTTGKQTEALLTEVAALSDRIHLRVINPRVDPEMVATYGVELDPAVVVERRTVEDDGLPAVGRVRMYGLPSGYEFMTLLDAVTAASRAAPKLRSETLDALARVTDPLHIQVFVTPT